MALEPVVNTVNLVNQEVKNSVNQIASTTNNIANTVNNVQGSISGLAREGFNGINVITDTLRDVNKNLTNIVSTDLSKFLSDNVKKTIDADIYKGALSTFNNVKDSVSDNFGFIKDGVSTSVEIFNVGREVFGQLNNIRRTFTPIINNNIQTVRNVFDTDFRNPNSLGNKILRDAGIEVGGSLRSTDELKRQLNTININRIRRDVNRDITSSISDPLDDIRISIDEIRNNRNNILNKLRGNVDNDVFYEIKRQLDGIVDTAEGIDENDLRRRVSTFERFVNDNVDGELTQELTDRIIVNGFDPYLDPLRMDEKTVDLLDDYKGKNINLHEVRDLSDFLTNKYGCDLGGERITNDVIRASDFSSDQNFYNNLVRYLIDAGLNKHLDCILRGGGNKYNNRSLHSVLSKASDEIKDSSILRIMWGNKNVISNKEAKILDLLTA